MINKMICSWEKNCVWWIFWFVPTTQEASKEIGSCTLSKVA